VSDKKPKRLQSQTERDMEGLAARKEREMSPHGLAAVPKEFDIEEDSTAHELEERERIREERDDKDRIRKVEKKIDHDRDHFNAFKLEVVERLTGVEGGLERVEGQIGGVSTAISDLRSDMRIDRELRQKEQLLEKEVRLKGELADKEAEQKLRHVRETTDIDLDREEKITHIRTTADKVMWTRKLILQAASGLLSASVIGALIALLAKRC